jgi:hypothetical protein
MMHCQMQQARMSCCISTVHSAPRYPVWSSTSSCLAISELTYDKMLSAHSHSYSSLSAYGPSGNKSLLKAQLQGSLQIIPS